MKAGFTTVVCFGLMLTALVGCTCAPKCNASNCATGCCDSMGLCQMGTEHAECGTGASACVVCARTATCTAHVCTAIADGGSMGGGSSDGGSLGGGSVGGGSAGGGSVGGGAAGGGSGGGSSGGGSAGGGSTGGGSTGGGSAGGGSSGGGAAGGGFVSDGGTWCSTPGSVVFSANGRSVVPGSTLPTLNWLTVPNGFCFHHFGTVANARQIKVAPGGEVFVASPTMGTTGGTFGRAAISVLADDDHDGNADGVTDYLTSMPATQGLAFTPGWIYYQAGQSIYKRPYTAGQRTAQGTPTEVINVNQYYSPGHWPKNVDIADDGTVYVSNGGDQGESCDQSFPFHGGILAVDGTAHGRIVARGFRNPISLRCQRGHNKCFAVELARDYSATVGGREKLVPIRDGDNWGFPCCASANLPFSDVMPVPNCSTITQETAGFYIGQTPFGFEFEPGIWAGTYNKRVYVTLHGEFGTNVGASIVSLATDPQTGDLVPGGTRLPDGGVGQTGSLQTFATGWDDRTLSHGRPSDLTFGPDGRMYVADDNLGEIFWVAPVDLPR